MEIATYVAIQTYVASYTASNYSRKNTISCQLNDLFKRVYVCVYVCIHFCVYIMLCTYVRVCVCAYAYVCVYNYTYV